MTGLVINAAEVERLDAALQRVRDLHRSIPLYEVTPEECGHDTDTYGIEIDGMLYCTKHVHVHVCEHCHEMDELGNADVEYPCPTIRALDGEQA